jgi:serine phosphatase RsbU (regulator of sigma subunit)
MGKMNTSKDSDSKEKNREYHLTTGDILYGKFVGLMTRRTDLWRPLCEFAKWVEYDAGPLAVEKNQDSILIDLDSAAHVQRLWIGKIENHDILHQHRVLWKYLVSLGIQRLCLDPRLEKNQIQDLLLFLKSREKALRIRSKSPHNALSVGLLEGNTVHLSCADISLQDTVLTAKYSYCTLRYSRLVHWFEQRDKSLRDHRSLFHMAPRFGLIGAAIIFMPSLLFVCWYMHWFLLALLLTSASVLFAMIYLFLMIVGSVEYDNEEKSYQLSRAYTQLKFYAARVQADIQRAQTIQQCFLPDAAKMPKYQLIDWASNYQPAEEVGGDYFDVKPLDDDRIVLVFGDVCGHGMAAALVTAILKTSFQDWLEKPTSLENLALQLNRNTYFITPIGSFAAVFLAILNCKTRHLEYINCGHQPEPWFLQGASPGQIGKLDQAPCMIMGIEEDTEIKKATVSLDPGDTILMASDGIVENRDVDGQFYGEERFEDLLRTNAQLSMSKLAQLITQEAESFAKGTSLHDDQTLLMFRFKEDKEALS